MRSLLLLLCLAQDADRDKKLQQRVDAIAEKVEATLGIKLKNKVPAAHQSPEDFARMLKENLEKELPKEKMEAVTRYYRLLGLVPDDFDFAAAIISTMKSQAGAYYNPETKRMYVLMGQMPDNLLDMMVFHELVHAVQDQEHDLAKNLKALQEGNDGDAAHAYRFLVEGEANFWMQINMIKSLGMDFDTLPDAVKTQAFGQTRDLRSKDIVDLMDMQATQLGDSAPALKEAAAQIRKVPPILIRSLIDPYLRGMYAAYRIHAQNGREGLRERFKAPPASTRDALFADDWLKAPRPVSKVRLAPLQASLGPDWKMIHEETAGALTLHVMFEDQKPQSDAVARGWDGDRIQVWRKGDQALVAGLFVFATPEAASTFAKQLERVYREQWTRGGKIEGDAPHLWSGADHLHVQARDNRVAFSRGADAKLLDTLWKSEVKAAEPAKAR